MTGHELQVLAVASHVSYGYVGNKMVTAALTMLNADVSAIHTVHFSNHTAYKQFTGRRVSAGEIRELFQGLVDSHLADDFDVLLTGYTGSAEAVRAVGDIGRDLRRRRGGDVFWIMDPVMGDAGRLYVAEDIPQVYRSLMPLADLILPNAFELEVLAESEVRDLQSCISAVDKLHKQYGVRNVVVTSMRLKRQDLSPAPLFADARHDEVLGVIGRTGDMFAALMAVRLRETADMQGLVGKRSSWAPDDEVATVDTPLAKATEKVLASMYAVLVKTTEKMKKELASTNVQVKKGDDHETAEHLGTTKASEVRIVQFGHELKNPPLDGFEGVKFNALDVTQILARLS